MKAKKENEQVCVDLETELNASFVYILRSVSNFPIHAERRGAISTKLGTLRHEIWEKNSSE